MNGSFNGQILVDKLVKLNSTQQSIETLSHWCIFHRNKARQVVETWERQFHCAPREQRISFLYLANDILQNSRRKGVEFISEFWRVLPGALLDALRHGDDSSRNAVLRLVDIWEERKVFGSRGQTLKEELLGKDMENRNTESKTVNYKLKQPGREMLDKIISGFENVYDLSAVDEDLLFGKCQITINSLDKTEREHPNKSYLGKNDGLAGEVTAQHSALRECINQLKSAESSRNILSSLLKEALLEQDTKIQQIRTQIQVAQSRIDQAGTIPAETLGQPAATLAAAASGGVADGCPPSSSEDRKSAAAAVAAKLAASTCSAEMLSLVFSSLAQSNPNSNPNPNPNPNPSESKRPKLEHAPSPPPPPPPESLPPVPPPPPPPESPATAGPMSGLPPFPYVPAVQFPPPAIPGYTMLVPPPFMGGPGTYRMPDNGTLFSTQQVPPFNTALPHLSRQ